MLRLMEVLLHAGTRVLGWRTAEIHEAILSSFALAQDTYSLTQLRYGLRKMKAHGLLERDGRRYAYRLTDKTAAPLSKIEVAYRKADRSLEQVIQLLAA
jgi:hypothetical protein